MAKITRKEAKIFGSSAGASEIAKFGSLAAGTPVFSTDPDVIQALANYLEGWFAAVLGGNSPAIEDMNALCFLFSRQISYLFQTGVAEWLSTTTYFIGSFVSSGSTIYVSLTDNNTGNAVSDSTKWQPFGSGSLSGSVRALNSNTVLTNTDNGKLLECTTTGGAFTVTLPASPSATFKCTFKDVAGTFGTNPLTIDPNGKALEGLSASYVAYANWWDRTVFYDGTAYFLV